MAQLQPPGSLGLPGSVHVVSREQLYDDLAEALMAAATEAVEARGIFHLALSGGSTPEPFFVRLVIDPRYRLLPWPQTQFWQVDERVVPDDDPRRNLKMIRETLTDHLPILPRQLHGIPVRGPEPDRAYEAELAAFTDQGTPGKGSREQGEEQPGRLRPSRALDPSFPRSLDPFPLDFILLGLGSDGHTASLFPGSPVLVEQQRWIVGVDDPGPTVNPRVPRVTMTLPLLNAARQLAVLVTGADKSAILRRIEEQLRQAGPDPQHLPITGVQPVAGQLSWWLDAAAVQGASAKP